MNDLNTVSRTYNDQGYAVLRGFYNDAELIHLQTVLTAFHNSWKTNNQEFYLNKAINSAYLTGTEHLNTDQRNILFQFIGSNKLADIVKLVIPKQACFMNTQLFFNPVNLSQKNYWHRDAQYSLSVQEQERALTGPTALHLRLALADEPGLELVPGSHKRWDTEEELSVRLEQNGHRNFEDLSTGLVVELQKGDLLIFSANMIHRGLYGKDRFAFDMLFCDPEPELLKHAKRDCFPSATTITKLEDPSAFLNTLRFL